MSRLGWFGVGVSILYILIIACLQHTKLAGIVSLSLNNFGDFLAGVLGPLGIFWLVLGFFQQGSELRNSIKALDLQTKELQQSVEQQKELAKATNEQLKLQQEEFSFTTGELTKSRAPKFVVSYLGFGQEASHWDDKKEVPLKHKIAFANVGGTACEVEIFLAYGALEPDEGPIVIWPQFETKQRVVELFASDTHGDSIQLHITYKDADGNEGLASRAFVRVSNGDHPKFEIH